MTFRTYLRWEGSLFIAVGIILFALGTAEGHESRTEAVSSGVMMIIGTGAFMRLRHGARVLAPGGWFTRSPLKRVTRGRDACSRARLLLIVTAEAAATASLTVGLSHVTGFWLTYMDFGVWAVVMGLIKVWPSATAVMRHEMQAGTTYRVVRRPLNGHVQLSPAPPCAPVRGDMGSQPDA